ncbi:MAG: monovalent cation/H+ antiporter complex subunit F [Desulfurococcaceae archaeon]|jgi:multicomponent Na+:H+ antiporter subunit F|nr:monovalent cation/H+ antiporter complex subunit F [Desulfurococcaceae archaeon]MCC6052585.1 monovalent cation/H+ antiporter complex subunit F [Desulfurococcaceae archaeon]
MDLILALILLYVVAILLLSIVALRGQTIGDQVLAIDVITYMSLVLLSLITIYLKQPLLIVLLIPLALWVYALDIYIAKYLERGDLGA